MHRVLTPEPHFIPGYTGHCPHYMYRAGGTYGHLTHKNLIAPCAGHSKDSVLSPISSSAKKRMPAFPTKSEIRILKDRESRRDVVYRDPIIPGYMGFIPKMPAQVGKRFLAAATSAVNEHEEAKGALDSDRLELKHKDILVSGQGLFNPKMNERLALRTTYNLPLIPVKRGSAAFSIEPVLDMKPGRVPYSKETPPHFMEDDNEEKWILAGYCGHIPYVKWRFGECNKALTKNALIEFRNNIRSRKLDVWCRSNKKSTADKSKCPSKIDCQIYKDDFGIVPNYTGHVPGHKYKVGLRFNRSSANAKRWLRDQGDIHCYDY